LKGNIPISDAQQGEDDDDDDDEPRKGTTKKKKKEIELLITSRVSGATKHELERLIKQEVIENSV
jgi:hypothetical protein